MTTNSWRIQGTHAEETRAVKQALSAAGIRPLRVGHGTGTAWGWLHIRIEHYRDMNRAIEVALAATGRKGDYDGRIGVDWNDRD